MLSRQWHGRPLIDKFLSLQIMNVRLFQQLYNYAICANLYFDVRLVRFVIGITASFEYGFFLCFPVTSPNGEGKYCFICTYRWHDGHPVVHLWAILKFVLDALDKRQYLTTKREYARYVNWSDFGKKRPVGLNALTWIITIKRPLWS